VIPAYIDEHRERVVAGRRLGGRADLPGVGQRRRADRPSTYYAVKTRPPSARTVRDEHLAPLIRWHHKDGLGVCGGGQVHATLNRPGTPMARCTVERLMKDQCLGPWRATAQRALVNPEILADLRDRFPVSCTIRAARSGTPCRMPPFSGMTTLVAHASTVGDVHIGDVWVDDS